MKRTLCLFLIFALLFVLVACNTAQDGTDGANGVDGVDGVDGKDGEDGADGKDGADGVDGVDGKDGKDGADGKDGKDGADGKDGEDGEDGKTPYIGANGNWWIGDVDTGVLADYAADDRKISDGLIFVTATVGGAAGMVVTEYEGTDIDVVIPNYVGSVPVIGIAEDAFSGNSSIKSVSLSKNTVWLDQEVFYNCSNLSSIDFNGAKLTEIPYRAFYGTDMASIKLPDTVTKLGDYAFYNSALIEINYENITHFGSYALNSLCLPYIYLTRDVEYVGNNAFSETFVFVEHETLPSTWSGNISGSSSMFAPVVGAVKSGEYIYTSNDSGITLHRYIGISRRLQIPSVIDNYKVTKIGAGFDSYSENVLDELAAFAVYQKTHLIEVVIPNTVAEIEKYAFLFSSSFIYIPKSVESITFGGDEEYFLLSFFAFEDDDFGTQYEGDLRYANDINYKKVVYDEAHGVFLYEDLFGYSILASIEHFSTNEIIVPGNYNNKKVHTVKSWAYYVIDTPVRITNGVTKIQKYAFLGEVPSIFIPKSVSAINAYGICDADYYLVEAVSNPDDWDTYWNGNRSGVTYGVSSDTILDVTSKMMYKVENGKATLTKYLGSSSTINIPRTVGEYTVTKIASDFYTSGSTRYIYIPKEVENIEAKAFTNSGYSTYYFYFEVSEQPATWSNTWYYNSYYQNSTSCITKYWNRTFSY